METDGTGATDETVETGGTVVTDVRVETDGTGATDETVETGETVVTDVTVKTVLMGLVLLM